VGKVDAEIRKTAAREKVRAGDGAPPSSPAPPASAPTGPQEIMAPAPEEARTGQRLRLPDDFAEGRGPGERQPRRETRWLVTPAAAAADARPEAPKAPEKAARAGKTPDAPDPSADAARRPVRTDEVGSGLRFVKSAVGADTVPRVTRAKTDLLSAPMGPREAYVLDVIDGATSVQGLLDVTGMTEAELHQILDRLRRLGIISMG